MCLLASKTHPEQISYDTCEKTWSNFADFVVMVAEFNTLRQEIVGFPPYFQAAI